jgi:hypothetical protein
MHQVTVIFLSAKIYMGKEMNKRKHITEELLTFDCGRIIFSSLDYFPVHFSSNSQAVNAFQGHLCFVFL